MARTYIAHLDSNSDALFSRNYEMDVEKEEAETPDAYERRTWRHKVHTNNDGFVMIPPAMFKKAIDGTAELLSIPIPNKHPKKYTPLIKAGIIIPSPIILNIKPIDTSPRWIFVYSNPSRKGSRVWKCFPSVKSWSGDLTIEVTSDDLPEDVVRHHVELAGLMRGVGSFTARSGGWHGSFKVKEWVEVKYNSRARAA